MITGGDAAYSVLEGCHKSQTDSLLFSRREESCCYFTILSRLFAYIIQIFGFFCFFPRVVGADFYEDRVERSLYVTSKKIVFSTVEMKISFDSKLFASKVFEFDQYYSVINSSRNNGYIEKNFHSKFFHNRKSCHKSETNLLLIEFNNSIIILYFKI